MFAGMFYFYDKSKSLKWRLSIQDVQAILINSRLE